MLPCHERTQWDVDFHVINVLRDLRGLQRLRPECGACRFVTIRAVKKRRLGHAIFLVVNFALVNFDCVLVNFVLATVVL